MTANHSTFFGPGMQGAVLHSFTRLTPRYQMRNPVMFTVFVCAILTTIMFGYNLVHATTEPSWFIGWVAFWLWFTAILRAGSHQNGSRMERRSDHRALGARKRAG